MDPLTVATLVLAVVAALTFVANWRVARSTEHQARLASQMLVEAQRDRELAHHPYLTSQEIAATRVGIRYQYRVSNAGRGPAIRCRGLLFDPSNEEQHWFEAPIFDLSPGGSADIPLHGVGIERIHQSWATELDGLGDWADQPGSRELLVCTDVFGRVHRFQPDSAVPEVLVIEGDNQRWVPWFSEDVEGVSRGQLPPPTTQRQLRG